MSAKYLGEFEQAILLAVLRLGDEAYGRGIRQELEECTGRKVSHGAAYITLDRMQAKGLLESWLADPAEGRGGRAKRYFLVTGVGVKALRESRDALMSLWDGVEKTLEES
jgi:PadR family transcriptional regulator PadR